MSDQSTNLMLAFLAAGQAQKHVTINETLLRLDAIVQLAVASASTTAQPASPTDGQVYILPAGKTGTDWGAMTNHALAYYRDGIWEQITPREGFLAWVRDTNQLKAYDGAAWIPAVQTFLGQAPIVLEYTDDGAGEGPLHELYRVSASPAASDELGAFYFYGRDSAGVKTFYAGMRAVITDPTDGSEDGRMVFRTIVNGAAGTRCTVQEGLMVGSPTGGDKGAGTINAVAVYDDNTLLTCGPVELLNTGKIDLEKWDAFAPDIEHPAEFEDVVQEIDGVQRIVGRREIKPARTEARTHGAMRHFAAMLEQGFDPRDPANFCARLKADGAVPGLITEPEWRAMLERGEKPDTGMALTRTFLALDNLAVAFSALAARVEALETVAAPAPTR